MKDHFNRRMKSFVDKQQAKFNNKGDMEVRETSGTKTNVQINTKDSVMCPFCLYESKLSSFLISNKKGLSQGLAKCPECKNTMQMHNLCDIMNVKEYAKWVYEYGKFGFWKKCPFIEWKKRLSHIGWQQEFWDEYKALKIRSKILSSDESIINMIEKQSKDMMEDE